MEHTRKMAFVDPWLLASFRPPADTADKVLRGLDSEQQQQQQRQRLVGWKGHRGKCSEKHEIQGTSFDGSTPERPSYSLERQR